MFLEDQGFIMKENTLDQDNQSATKIEQNGKHSSGQKQKKLIQSYSGSRTNLEQKASR